MAQSAENDVPPCPTCGKPLGLYYAQCRTCYAHAGDYTLSDYTRAMQGLTEKAPPPFVDTSVPDVSSVIPPGEQR